MPAPLRIVVGDLSGARVCPFCRDALPDEAAAVACGSCGTGYHPECARLNGGACSLFGCAGTCGEGPRAVRYALALRPPADPTRSQVEGLARLEGLQPYDARIRLRSRIPVVLRYVERGELAPREEALRALGLEPFAVESALLAREPSFRVRTVARAPGGLLLTALPGEQRVLDLAAPRRVVTGWIQESHEQVEHRFRGREGDPDGRHRAAWATHSTSHIHFAHVYLDGEPDPLVFEADALGDYRFLGEDMSISGGVNFRRLIALLAQGARRDDTLEHLQGGQASISEAQGRRSTSRPWNQAASRLIAYAARPAEPSSGGGKA